MTNDDEIVQHSFDGFGVEQPERSKDKKLRLPSNERNQQLDSTQSTQAVTPTPILPTRWEHLQPRLGNQEVTIRTIIRPVDSAMDVVRSTIDYLNITSGCQILVIRADSGSGKTTFLNTLAHYMPDVEFHQATIDMEYVKAEDFKEELQQITTYPNGINMIILEGREKPKSITDEYIQITLSSINRFARARRVPLFVVIPTIEEQVARIWCEHGSRIGDLIPEGRLYNGARWYDFPGVLKEQFIPIVEETVKALNPHHTLYDFLISPDEVQELVNVTPTIGRFIEVIAGKISERRESTRIVLKGKKQHIWVVFCNPDLRHYDHTFQLIQGLAQDETLRISPIKLVPPSAQTPIERDWKSPENWSKLVVALNFLDVRVINLPITTVVTSALTYADEELLRSFKSAVLSDYREQIVRENLDVDNWAQPLSERRLQDKNARDSLARTNLYRLLRNMPSEPQKGGAYEQALLLAQYLHLLENTSESERHYYLGKAFDDLLRYHQLSGFIGVETEEPLIDGQREPQPDITIHTNTDVYALELHFQRKQIAASEARRYVINKITAGYMRSLRHVSSQLDI
jgi:energy-coupling factor transporter ATP-binding protein EcfA2